MILVTASAAMCLASPNALAQGHADHAADTHAAHVDQAKPVNAMCPIGKEPIVPSAGTVEYKGYTIGLCCPSCGKNFLAWNEQRKDEFITLAIAGTEPGHEAHADKPSAEPQTAVGDPYPLSTCPVSGGKLGSMGDPVVKVYDGREVRFCCANCIGKFEAAKNDYFAKIDEQIIADQLPFYPVETCVVTGEPLAEKGKDIAVDTVIGNRLVRTCCMKCVRKVNAEPERYLAKLDKATADAQRPDYPLTTCVVSGGALGSMGEPAEMVVAGRLIRLCCANCEPKVKADPATYLMVIDKAWHEKGKYVSPDTDDHHNH